MEVGSFKKRQVVKKRRQWVIRLRQVERALLSLAVILAGLGAIYGLYLLVFLSGTFSIDNIVIEGEWRYLSAQGLAELSGVSKSDNLFWTSIEDVHAKLMQDPWVKAAAVRRKPPDTLWIYAEEYKPVALAIKGELMFVEEGGKIFKSAEADEEKNLPVLTGIDKIENSEETIRSMLTLIGKFRNSNFGKELDVSEVHFDEAYGYSVITKKTPIQVVFGYAAFDDVLSKLDRMSVEVKKRSERITYMIANEPNRLTVKYRMPSAEAVLGPDRGQDI